MSWQESTKTAFEWVNLYWQMPLGVIGFGVAWYQIWQAKKAAEAAKSAADAAKSAAENARSQFRTMSVTVLLPQLRSLEEAVDRAIHDKSLPLLMHLLQDWRWQASTCREYLNEAIQAEVEAMTNIQKSIAAATALKQKFMSFDQTTDWAKETGRLRRTMADVTANLGALSAQQTVKES